jgi:hypothetical protein
MSGRSSGIVEHVGEIDGLALGEAAGDPGCSLLISSRTVGAE